MNAESDEASPQAGYRVDRIYSVQRTLKSAGDDSDLAEGTGHFEIIWDWRIPNVDKVAEAITEEGAASSFLFEVAVGAEVPGSEERPEDVRTILVGRFELGQGNPSVPLLQFAKLHAVALVYPYLREAVSELTDMSLYGTYYLPVLNVEVMMKDFEMIRSTGWGQLQERPDLAAALGVAPSEPEASQA